MWFGESEHSFFTRSNYVCVTAGRSQRYLLSRKPMLDHDWVDVCMSRYTPINRDEVRHFTSAGAYEANNLSNEARILAYDSQLNTAKHNATVSISIWYIVCAKCAVFLPAVASAINNPHNIENTHFYQSGQLSAIYILFFCDWPTYIKQLILVRDHNWEHIEQ